jgi:hypothetical protein
VINWVSGASWDCLWKTTAVSRAWEDPNNWSACNDRSGVPDQNDWVEIPSTGLQPIISGGYDIRGFGGGTGSGTVTLFSGSTLYVHDYEASFTNDVSLEGEFPACTDCLVRFVGDAVINGGGAVTLKRGVQLLVNNDRSFWVGDGMSEGHLATDVAGSMDPAEWPVLGSGGAVAYTRIKGSATTNSSVNINGLRFVRLQNDSWTEDIIFNQYYTIDAFDNVQLETENAFGMDGRYIVLEGCATATFTDVQWDGLSIPYAVNMGGYNIDAETCSSAPTLTISGSGTGYGAMFELDPYMIINWL